MIYINKIRSNPEITSNNFIKFAVNKLTDEF